MKARQSWDVSERASGVLEGRLRAHVGRQGVVGAVELVCKFPEQVARRALFFERVVVVVRVDVRVDLLYARLAFFEGVHATTTLV
jgi:hypothetical protein